MSKCSRRFSLGHPWFLILHIITSYPVKGTIYKPIGYQGSRTNVMTAT
ncbi:MAG: hypothetical protein HXS44_10790 [Theionarchaea archaeon]|nr:hypothetical protein [Theionarchaea archaeon]